MEKKDFSKLCDELQYLSIGKTTEKYSDDVAEEIRDYIRKSGWPCLGDTWSAEEEATEFFDENYPDFSSDEIEECSVCSIEFLCENEYYIEHDVDWCEFNISFFGKWGEVGVFHVWK